MRDSSVYLKDDDEHRRVCAVWVAEEYRVMCDPLGERCEKNFCAFATRSAVGGPAAIWCPDCARPRR